MGAKPRRKELTKQEDRSIVEVTRKGQEFTFSWLLFYIYGREPIEICVVEDLGGGENHLTGLFYFIALV